jgi:hypothetical protein
MSEGESPQKCRDYKQTYRKSNNPKALTLNWDILVGILSLERGAAVQVPPQPGEDEK